MSGPVAAPTPVSLHAASAGLRGHPAPAIVYPLSVTSGPRQMLAQKFAPQQLVTQQVIRQPTVQPQLAQKQTRQQSFVQPQQQVLQLNMHGQSVTLDQVNQSFLIKGANDSYYLMPAVGLQGGRITMPAAQPVSVVAAPNTVTPQALPAPGPALQTTTPKPPPADAGNKKRGRPKSKLNEQTAAPAAGAATAPQPAKPGRRRQEPQKAPTPPPPKEPTPPPPQPPAVRTYSHKISSSSSSESERSRSPSPADRDDSNDPLSLFKNVVHIQAPVSDVRYFTSKSSPASKPSPDSKKAAPTSVAKPRAGPRSRTLTVIAPTLSAPPAPAAQETESAPGKSRKGVATKYKISPNVNTSKPLRLLASFDLTDSPKTPPTKPSRLSDKPVKNLNATLADKPMRNLNTTLSDKPVKNLNATLNKPSTISGTSKNIIIGGAGKTLSKTASFKKGSDATTSRP